MNTSYKITQCHAGFNPDSMDSTNSLDSTNSTDSLNPTNSLDSQQGLTLIEMLLAVFILAAILTALLSGMLFTVNTLNEAKYRATATAIASSCMDRFVAARQHGWINFCGENAGIGEQIYSYQYLRGAGGLGCNDIVPPAEADDNTDPGTYYTVVSVDGNCASDNVKIIVQTNWARFRGNNAVDDEAEFDNVNRTATMEHIFTRYAYEPETN